MSAEGPNTAGTNTTSHYDTKNCQKWHDATGPPSPYRHMNLGFSSWDTSHVEGALGHEEPCGGHCSILGSQPVDDQLGSVLVSAEEDLQGPKVSAGASWGGRNPKTVPGEGGGWLRGSGSPGHSC